MMQCQKCRIPIAVDESLVDLNPASFRILVESARVAQPPQSPALPSSTAAARQRRDRYDRAVQDDGPRQENRIKPSPQKLPNASNPAMSFVMLSQSQIGTPVLDEDKSVVSKTRRTASTVSEPKVSDDLEKLSQQMEKSQRLFEILSARSDIDHPVCAECTELLITGLQQRQTSVARERDAYADYLKKAQRNVPNDAEQQEVHRALIAAQEQEAEALMELEKLEAEREALEDEIAALDQESLDLEDEQQAFWRDRNAFEADLAKQQDQHDSLRNQLAHESAVLEALQRTNVYNDSFCIGHDGHFGTINGLRLGRLPDHPVEWAEINAAWGQCVLLLVVVAEKLGFTFQGYRLLPIGSTSRIERLDVSPGASRSDQARTKSKVTQFDLFTSGDLPLGLGFLHRGFDNAMVCFLDCLGQLGDHVARPATGSGVKMPYNVQKDKIGDTSIKLGAFNQEEMWTKACKYTLTCCKFLLAHASHVDDSDETRRPKR